MARLLHWPGLLTAILLSLAACRALDAKNAESEEQTTSEPATTVHPDDVETGPSLGQVLGVFTLVIIAIYIFGISWKVIKIYRGDYEPQEPVYLKYK